MYHIPVMPSEVSNYLISNPAGFYVDATFGGGGHTIHLLKQYEQIKILAFDWDETSEREFLKHKQSFEGRLSFIRDNFANIAAQAAHMNINGFDGILADIGFSSEQVDDMDRGFSFNSERLDMRMDLRSALDAKTIINSYPQDELADIFYQYGGERFSRQIAKAIFERRQKGKINSSLELADLIGSVKYRRGKTDPATKVFQALRIFVNDELSNLQKLLSQAPSLLNQNGRLVIIDFHSLEDRMVKMNFKENKKAGVYKILTKKPLCTSQKEVRENPRSRSAKLRAVQKL
jgi:16S rRNA (cytosine1402-N4)-methyltransferase